MGAISTASSELFFQTKQGYFSQEDTIELLEALLDFHKHRQVAVFWDNASIHKGRRVQEFIDHQPRLTSICNLEYEPELNGIETLWNSTKQKFIKALTEEKLKPIINFNTVTMVHELLEETDSDIIYNCAKHGWRQIFTDKRSALDD